MVPLDRLETGGWPELTRPNRGRIPEPISARPDTSPGTRIMTVNHL